MISILDRQRIERAVRRLNRAEVAKALAGGSDPMKWDVIECELILAREAYKRALRIE